MFNLISSHLPNTQLVATDILSNNVQYNASDSAAFIAILSNTCIQPDVLSVGTASHSIGIVAHSQ